MQLELFAVRIVVFGTHGTSKKKCAAVLTSRWMIPMLYIQSPKIFVAMLVVDIIGRNRIKLCGMNTSDARNAVESSARLMEEKRTDVIDASRSIRFIASNMTLCFQIQRQGGYFL
jgi:hypothetical protein|nr:MAG TPA: hypothetical protein [Caudoviricetes sp.]